MNGSPAKAPPEVLWVRGGTRQKLIYGGSALRVLLRSHRVSARARNQSTLGAQHCLVLHGWSLSERDVSDLTQTLSQLEGAQKWNFWDISYDTQWTSFPDSARRIAQSLRETGADFSQTILLGYSMGGLVARQMVADGWPCRALVTLCAPHQGPRRFLPPIGHGPRSLMRSNQLLSALNSHPRDIAMRERYHFFAVTYDDRLGHHEHDGIVSRPSALGMNLDGIGHRHTMALRYRSIAAFDPHWRGKDPRFVRPALDCMTKLFCSEDIIEAMPENVTEDVNQQPQR
ncbi:MAG: PGAP1-like protein [Abditibacteriota bacterium]|nr:PGAP1-like protein [Abditibacteriota bacterium]